MLRVWVLCLLCVGCAHTLLFHSDHEGPRSTTRLAPCQFNGLCRCSGTRVDWGVITCHDVPMGDIPAQINNTRVLSLALSNNKLHVFSAHRFHRTGLWRLEIRHNSLSRLDANALSGLEYSLWELDLQYNRFASVPKETFFRLQKLNLLDLSGNMISSIEEEDFKALKDSLESLYLRDNAISTIDSAPFSKFSQLRTLDLSGNQLFELGQDSLKTSQQTLTNLYLTDNLFQSVPGEAIGNVGRLDLVDLTGNVIESPSNSNTSGQIDVHTMRLDHNNIMKLDQTSLSDYGRVEKLYLSGNPLETIEPDTFAGSSFKELYINNTYLWDFGNESFAGLENSLETLDLTENNMTLFHESYLLGFNKLQKLYISDNEVSDDVQIAAFTKLDNLRELSLSGKSMPSFSLTSFQNLTHLRYLSVRMKESSLDEKSVNGKTLEKLSLAQSGLTSIQANAFDNFSGLRYLDISHNSIKSIDDLAFQKSGHAIEVLEAFSGLTLNDFPTAFTHFTNIRHFHLAGSSIGSIAPNSFDQMYRLEVLDMESNKLTGITPDTFKSRVLRSLWKIDFNFNQLGQLQQKVFYDLPSLVDLRLAYNKINGIEQGAFVRLDKLRNINLRMNQISNIEKEAFQNLPYLDVIDLSHNKLTKMSFGWFELVGTLSPSMKLDASFNKIRDLDNSSSWRSHINIKELDLSHNSITSLYNKFLQNVRSSLLKLSLAHNEMKQLSYDNTGYLPNLLVLDLSGNKLEIIDPGTFSGMEWLNVLNLSHNSLHSLPSGIFDNNKHLNTLDLSFNGLHSLQDNLFKGSSIEVLFLQGNQFQSMPSNSFLHLSRTVRHIDISHNQIHRLQASDMGSLYNVVYLDLSKNEITSFEDGVFFPLQKISYLDLSNNRYQGDFRPEFIEGIESTLAELRIANLSIPTIPKLKLPFLIKLDLGYNIIEFPEDKEEPTTEPPVEKKTPYLVRPKITKEEKKKPTDTKDNKETDGKKIDEEKAPDMDMAKSSSLLAPELATTEETNIKVATDETPLENDVIATLQTTSEEILPSDLTTNQNNDNDTNQKADDNDNLVRKYTKDKVEVVDMSNAKAMPSSKSLIMISLKKPGEAMKFRQGYRRESGEAMEYRHVYSGVDESLPMIAHSNTGDPFVTMPLLRDLNIRGNSIKKLTNTTFSTLGQLQKLDISELPLKDLEYNTLHPLKKLSALGVGTYSGVRDFSITKLVQHNQGLGELKITVEGERLESELHQWKKETGKPNWWGGVPPHIRTIAVQGKDLITVDHNAFKDVHSWRLNLTIEDTKMNRLDKEVVSNMKQVSEMNLNIRNNPMNQVGDLRMVKKVDAPNYIKLKGMRMSNNKFNCDCDSIGWVEWWVRRFVPDAFQTMMDAENSYCQEENITLAEAFRDSLECITISSSSMPVLPPALLLAFCVFLVRRL